MLRPDLNRGRTLYLQQLSLVPKTFRCTGHNLNLNPQLMNMAGATTPVSQAMAALKIWLPLNY